MTLKIWRGDAPAVAQVTRLTPANVQIGDMFTATINGKSITVTATAATVANVVSLLVAAIENSTIAEFQEITASAEGAPATAILLTANTAGIPFVVTSSTSNGSVLAVVVSTTTEGSAASAAVNMTQTFRVPLSAAGDLSIIFGGYITTVAIGASAATVQTAMEGLTSIGAGNVSVAKSTDSNDSIYVVTFIGAFAGTNVALLNVSFDSTKPTIRTTQEGAASGTPQNEIQTIGMADAYILGGTFGQTFTLTFDGQTTSALDGNASAATVQTALIALSSVDAAGVTVTMLGDGVTLQVEFVGTEGNAVQPQMTASVYTGAADRGYTVSVTSTPASPTGAPSNEVQVVTITGAPTGGTFTLTLGANTTAGLAYNAAAGTIQTALQGLASIGAGNATVTGPVGGPWTVTFVSGKAATNISQMTGDAAGLTGGSADTMTSAEVTASAGPNHWDTAANWLPVGVPITGDDVRFEIGNSDCVYGIDQTGITLASLWIAMTWTGKLGLPRKNSNGYLEYRTTALTCGITSCLVGYGDGSGPGKVALNTLAVQTAVEVRGSGGSSDVGIPAVTWRGSHASNVVTILDGEFGTAPYSDQSATMYDFLQRGGSVALKNTAVTNQAIYTRQSLSTHNCTLGGKVWDA